MLSRRALLFTPLALAPLQAFAQAVRLPLAIHGNTTIMAGYRRSVEGYARAGVTHIELVAEHVDEFLKTDTLAAARRVLTDNGMTPVSVASRVNTLWEPHPENASALDEFRKRCEQFKGLGLTNIYSPTGTMAKFTEDDYRRGADNMRAVGEVARQFGMTAMVEGVRASTFINTFPTLLRVTRAASHPNLKPLLDFYHFWSANNKLEDLDLLRNGEIGHVHFQDVPDMPREFLDNNTRFIPGDGISPLNAMLRKIVEKGYRGALSVELFLPRLRQIDPYDAAREIREKSERVMKGAGVL
jgi:sugar phosphate isomerase/epimerase